MKLLGTVALVVFLGYEVTSDCLVGSGDPVADGESWYEDIGSDFCALYTCTGTVDTETGKGCLYNDECHPTGETFESDCSLHDCQQDGLTLSRKPVEVGCQFMAGAVPDDSSLTCLYAGETADVTYIGHCWIMNCIGTSAISSKTTFDYQTC